MTPFLFLCIVAFIAPAVAFMPSLRQAPAASNVKSSGRHAVAMNGGAEKMQQVSWTSRAFAVGMASPASSATHATKRKKKGGSCCACCAEGCACCAGGCKCADGCKCYK